MATTTNFGWETPDDTDLVKDGALAMRTLGNSIDTSFVDLKGGTTGQILSKASNTDLDYTWINNDQGDITAVTAGTGISGGGTSGAVTITNSMATEITASGDIIVGTGSGTFDNLPIGTTGQVLTADTTVSPYKVKWASAAASSGPAFSAYKTSGDQIVTGGVRTAVDLPNENYDTDSCYNTSTYEFTPNKAGYYSVVWSIQGTNASGKELRSWLYKNGSVYRQGVQLPMAAQDSQAITNGSSIMYFNGTTDKIKLYGQVEGGGGTPRFVNNNEATFFEAVWIRS